MVNAVMILASASQPAAAEQKREQEQQVVPAGQDVLDAERTKLARPRPALDRSRGASRVSGANANCHVRPGASIRASVWWSAPRTSKRSSRISEVADRARARELHDQRHALRARRGRRRPAPGGAAPALGGERHLLADDAEQAVAARGVARARAAAAPAPTAGGSVAGHSVRRVADVAPSIGDRGVAGAAAGVRQRRARGDGHEARAAASEPAHGAVIAGPRRRRLARRAARTQRQQVVDLVARESSRRRRRRPTSRTGSPCRARRRPTAYCASGCDCRRSVEQDEDLAAS